MGRIIDSTLREGEQMCGVYFTVEQKCKIATLLHNCGIEELELGVVANGARNDVLERLMAMIRETVTGSRLSVWCRCLLSDVAAAAELKPDVVSVALPISDLHIFRRLNRSRAWIMEQIVPIISIAREKDVPYISFCFEDASRADTLFLESACAEIISHGADRIRFSDTVGIAKPTDVISTVRTLRKRWDIELAFHFHNDFGMATANAITALSEGAHWVDASLLGLGERAGIARLEEVAGYMAAVEGAPYDLIKLNDLCAKVSEYAGIPIAPNHPVVGPGIFSCESGIHLDGIRKDPIVYEPFSPELIGKKRIGFIGKKTGRRAVMAKLQELNLETPKDLEGLVDSLRTYSTEINRPLTDNEIKDMVNGRG